MALRRCTRTGCRNAAVATLTYVYSDQTAVLGPLAPEHVPGSYHLCATHCEHLSAPRGWQVIRLEQPSTAPAAPDEDDLLALANAVREVGMRPDMVVDEPAAPVTGNVVLLSEHRRQRPVDGSPRGS